MTIADVSRINETAPRYGRVKHTSTIPFGPHLALDRYDLDNGLRALFVVDRSAPLFACHTWYRVGSRDEREGKTGIAHLFEHLMFNETKNLPKGEFDRRLERVGAENNASTWLDFTQYNISAPKEQLELVIGMEAERMQHLVLREPQVESEKEVVANERRYRVDDDVEGTVNELLWATAFVKHPYKWPTIGWMSDILGFTTQDCEQFYRSYYAPNNATVVLVGDIDPTHALSLISQHHGQIPSTELPNRNYPMEPAQLEERRVHIDQPTVSEKLSMGYHSVAIGDPEHVAVGLLCEVLSGGRVSRLYRKLVREQKIASEVRAYVGPFGDPGLLEIYASAREKFTAEQLLASIDEELASLQREPVAQEELDRAAARMELGLLHSLESAEGKAQTIGFYDCILEQPDAAFQRLEALRRVTPDQLLDVARRAFDRTKRSVVCVHPDASATKESSEETTEETTL